MLKDMTLESLQDMVQKDAKTRFSLIQEPDLKEGSTELVWWIRANQGHSMKVAASFLNTGFGLTQE
jgi:2'-phosphotransferase